MNDLIAKLFALANRGEGGEKRNAEAALRRLLEREGITPAELEDRLGDNAAARHCEFSVADSYQRMLLAKIVASVVPGWDGAFYRYPGARSKLFYELTRRQEVEVRFLFELLLPILEDDLARFTFAFAFANGIRPLDPPPADDQLHLSPSREEMARLQKMVEAAKIANKHRQLKG
jgi:hypothetical protein